MQAQIKLETGEIQLKALVPGEGLHRGKVVQQRLRKVYQRNELKKKANQFEGIGIILSDKSEMGTIGVFLNR